MNILYCLQSQIEGTEIEVFSKKERVGNKAVLAREGDHTVADYVIIVCSTGLDQRSKRFDMKSIEPVVCETKAIGPTVGMLIKTSVPVRCVVKFNLPKFISGLENFSKVQTPYGKLHSFIMIVAGDASERDGEPVTLVQQSTFKKNFNVLLVRPNQVLGLCVSTYLTKNVADRMVPQMGGRLWKASSQDLLGQV